MSSNHSYAMERRSFPRSPLLKNSMPSSPYHMSPMLKSPMPKSPARCETYKSRCAHCLLGFFRFRHSNSKKLISDSRSASRHYGDDRFARNKLDWHPGVDEICECINTQGDSRNAGLRSGHKEMLKIKGQDVKSDSKSVSSRTKRHKKRRRARRLPIYGCYDVATMGFGKTVPERLMDRSSNEEESRVAANKDPSDSSTPPKEEINLQVHMNEAAEAFINQRFTDGRLLGEDEGKVQSKHFLDALGVLNTNKDLFAKLLRDPNSLLVKHIEDLRDSRQKVSAIANEPLETIVVLKPDVKKCDSSVDQPVLSTVQQSARPAFSSFTQMKRKLMKAIGSRRKARPLIQDDYPENKGKQGMEECDQGSELEIAETNLLEQSSPLEIQTKSKENRLRQIETGVRKESSPSSCNRSSTVVLLRKDRPKTWDGICSIDEVDSLHTVGPRGKRELGFVTPQMRISPSSNSQIVQESKCRNQRGIEINCPSPLRQSLETTRWVDARESFEMLETESAKPDGFSSNGEGSEGSSAFDNMRISSQACASPERQGDIHFEGISPPRTLSDGRHECVDAPRPFDPLRPDYLFESQVMTSSEADYMSSPPQASRIEGLDIKIEDKPEHPSPISVLEQFCTEDITSPVSQKSNPVDPSDLSIRTVFQEKCSATIQHPALNSDPSPEEHRSMSGHISSILHSAISSWDELLLRCYFSDPLLLEIVLDEVDICLCNDRILFEYINEVLLEAYDHCLRCSPWLSSTKSKLRPVSVAENATREVMRCIDWDLFLHHPMETVEEIIMKDLVNSRTWKDCKGETDDIVRDTVESIMQDLIMESAELSNSVH
ncbi:unnamed protein product [Linum trigynum]|uniref:DUF4378 domain-containing protein n=1 Tax=Linum trigynum TaxID=586398 RepID=A0AAV2DPE6_9ROSI